MRVRTTAIAGLAALALTAASVPALNLLVYSPARAVASYLGDIAAGDAEGARARLLTGTLENTAALTDDALAGAPSLPERVDVTRSETEGRRAVVTAEYDLAGSTRSQEFELTRDDGTWGLYHRWLIDVGELPRLELEIDGASAVRLNSADIEVDREGLPVLFPVEYNVGFAQEYFRSSVESVTALEPGEELSTRLAPQPTEQLREEAEELVHAHLDECVEAKTLLPTGCTFGYDSDNEILGDVSWEMVSYPAVRLRSERNRLVVAPASGVAQIKGRYRDIVTATESDFDETVRFTFTAAVNVEDGGPSIVPLTPGLASGAQAVR
jgi:hypothetical protein